jgi:ferric-dicitrate binding protein FerR (iron transport regulator)
MAKERRPDKAIQELEQEIADSRDRLARDLTGLRYELDFPRKLRKSFQNHAGLWISAAVLTGVVLTARAIPRKKIVYTTSGKAGRKNGPEQRKGLLQAGLVMGGLRFAAVLLRPVVVRFVTRKLGDYASGVGRRRKW